MQIRQSTSSDHCAHVSAPAGVISAKNSRAAPFVSKEILREFRYNLTTHCGANINAFNPEEMSAGRRKNLEKGSIGRTTTNYQRQIR